MVKQAQTELEEAEIASVGAMNDLVPSMLHGVLPEVDDPEIGQTCGDQKSGQTHRVRKVTLVDMKPAAFLVREEGFYLKPLPVIAAGLLRRDHVRNEMDGLLAVFSPPSDGEHRSVPSLCKTCAGNVEDFSGGKMICYVIERKFLTIQTQCRGLARTQDVFPLALVQKGLKINPVELAITQQHDLDPVGYQLLYLVHQIDVNSLREVPLFSLRHSPNNRQRPLFVNHTDHERHAAAADNAAVNGEHEGRVTQAPKQRLSKRQKEGLAFHGLVAEPSLEPFYTALGFCPGTFGPSVNLACDGGKIRAPAPYNSADHSGEGIQSAGQVTTRFFGEKSFQHVTDSLESFCCRSYQPPFSAVLAAYNALFKAECPAFLHA